MRWEAARVLRINASIAVQDEFNRMKAEHESLLDSLDAAERSRQELDGRLKAVTMQASRRQRQLR